MARAYQLHRGNVDVMDVDGACWLVAGYGVVNRVWNVRAAGDVTLARGRRAGRYRAREATPEEAAPSCAATCSTWR